MASAVEADIRDACEGLATFPYANPATDVANVFRMPISHRGFTVFHRVERKASVVEIVGSCAAHGCKIWGECHGDEA